VRRAPEADLEGLTVWTMSKAGDSGQDTTALSENRR